MWLVKRMLVDTNPSEIAVRVWPIMEDASRTLEVASDLWYTPGVHLYRRDKQYRCPWVEGGGRGNPIGYTGKNLLGEYTREGIISRVLRYKLRSLEKGVEFGKRRRVNFQRQKVSIS